MEQLATLNVPMSKALNPAPINVLNDSEKSADNERLQFLAVGRSQWPKLADCGRPGQLPGMNVHYCRRKCAAGHF